MSTKLALSTALSVMMMSAFVLFSAQTSLAPPSIGFDLNPAKAAASLLPEAGRLLPLGR